MKSWSLILLETSGPVLACTGIVVPLQCRLWIDTAKTPR